MSIARNSPYQDSAGRTRSHDLVCAGLGHIVQFYENEDFLYSVVSSFVADGLVAGEPVVVIADQTHSNGFRAALLARGFDVDVPAGNGQLTFLDARETLSAFMSGSVPDGERFKSAIGSVFARSANRHNAPRVRVYGEMVDLLWKDGNPDGALRVEELWNELASLYTFSLLCAYPIGNFYKETHRHHFEEICRSHAFTIPAESFSEADEQSRALEITRLQQRAGALEAEIEHRRELENALREALAARRRAEAENAFLLEVTTALHRSLDSEAQLREVTKLVVPRLADCCAADIVRDDGTVDRVCVAQADHHRLVPPAADIDVVHSGQTTYDSRSVLVPIKFGTRVLGAITFIYAESGRHYSESDLPLLTEVTRRAAVAVENARLYRLAQEANRAKYEFLATLSHELRTPLTAILGWAHMLRAGAVDPSTVETALETIERSARTQASLIDDILDLSKVVTGKLTLQMAFVDLRRVVENAMATVQLAAAAKRIRIDFISGTQPAFVRGDATRLQQIVWNLLSNAIKFSHQDGTVTVALDQTDSGARLVVRDEGHGIRPDFLPHVFEPFRQADAATTRAYGGLGLGLAIVKYFVELHGGSVSVVSAGEGHGATFTMLIPLAAQRPLAVSPEQSVSRADLRGICVLVVDDDDDARAIITTVLRSCGADVKTASSVSQACQIVERERPDILVTDLAMPAQDGFALIDYIRSLEGEIREMPAVALTAMGRADDEKRILAAGFQAYARKPIEPMELANVVAQVRRI